MSEPLRLSPTQTGRGLSGRLWVLALAAIAMIGWLVSSSPAFQECVHKGKNQYAYRALYENHPVAAGLARLHLQTVCVENWTNEYQGAIGALATLMVAIFTLTLSNTTKRLWQSAEDQLAEFRRSLAIADAHATHMSKSVAESARAADAAERSAIAAGKSAEVAARSIELIPTYERAYLSIGFNPIPSHGGLRFQSFFTNAGRTPGILRKISFRIQTEPLPDIPDYSGLTTEEIRTVVVTGSTAQVPQFSIPATPGYYCGYFVYADIFRILRTTWFAGRVHVSGMPPSITVRVDGGDAYNHYD